MPDYYKIALKYGAYFALFYLGVKYALPLIQGDSHPPVEDGLPRFAHLAKLK